MSALDSAAKRRLFIEMATRSEGTTAQDVHAEAQRRGATDTVESFHNLGRRLAHAGRLVVEDSRARRKVFFAKEDRDGEWIDEEQLQTIVDPERPMESLAVLREAHRQIRTIPSEAWAAAASLLRKVNAREAAHTAILAYTADLVDHLDDYGRMVADKPSFDPAELDLAQRRCEGRIELLIQMCRHGLGLSVEAIYIPQTPDAGLRRIEKDGRVFVDPDLLRDEIERRVENVPLLAEINSPDVDHGMVVAGVDGSTQGGLLSLDGTAGDFAFGAPPQINLNTAAAVINRKLRQEGRETEVFLRYPSSPEDIQRRDNVYTIMSPMFYPDLSESEYMHSAWNAMDVLESRAARRALDSWTTQRTNVEVRPADVVIRDGTVVPNDRDPSHYAQIDSYGRIVREMIELAWDTARKCRDDDQTVAGSVKNSRVRVVAPIINFIVAQAAGTPATNLTGWTLNEMNVIPDQQLLSRILSHADRAAGVWMRSAVFMRPFHATANSFSPYYSRDPGRSPAEQIRKRIRDAAATPVEQRTSDQHGWADMRAANPYAQLLDGAWYAGFYVSPGVSLGRGQVLPRMEMIITHPTEESGAFPKQVAVHQLRLLTALATTKFTVSKDHDMFGRAGTIDFQPTMLQRAHEIVNAFAKDMKMRAGEYLDRILGRELGDRRRQNVRVRPWRPEELQAWKDRMSGRRHDDDDPPRLVGMK